MSTIITYRIADAMFFLQKSDPEAVAESLGVNVIEWVLHTPSECVFGMHGNPIFIRNYPEDYYEVTVDNIPLILPDWIQGQAKHLS